MNKSFSLNAQVNASNYGYHSLRKYKKIDNFEALMDDDAILFLRAREEGTSVVSDDFLTSSAGIQIGLWAEELEVYTNREDCEVSQTEGGAWCH